MSKRKLKYGDLPKEPAPGVCLRCPVPMSHTMFALILDAPAAAGAGRNKVLLVCDAFDGPILALPYRMHENPRDVLAEHMPPVPVMPRILKSTWQERQNLMKEYGPGKRPDLLDKARKNAR
jgi:hypothetical protein